MVSNGANARSGSKSGEDFQLLLGIAHDLKEPLRTIRSSTEFLAAGEEAAQALQSIRDAVNRMQKLLDDALDFALVDLQGGRKSLVEMGVVLRFALSNLQTAIAESQAVVSSDRLPQVTANFGALGQVLQNLIANSIKYRSAGPPRIHVGCSRGQDGWTFSVADNGIGIEPESHEIVFLPLKRLHPRRQYPGNGLGLAICRRILEAHGGRIWVESQPGEGSTFYFTIPEIEPDSIPYQRAFESIELGAPVSR